VNSATTAHDFFDDNNDLRKTTTILEASDCIIDIREFDVPYHVRVAIDKGTKATRAFDINTIFSHFPSIDRHPSWKMVYC